MSLLVAIGQRVRLLRDQHGLTQKALAERAGLSLRFLSEVESGQGNISVTRLAELAHALGVGPASLLPDDPNRVADRVALLGVRGAGKSSVGRALAKLLSRDFIELDEEIERTAGLRLAEIFEIHGGDHYRRLEREVLRATLAKDRAFVLATGGGLVSDAESWSLLRRGARTVWLRATPTQHWQRVVGQGDARPMADRPRAMSELRALLAARTPRYAEADITVETGQLGVSQVAMRVRERLSAL